MEDQEFINQLAEKLSKLGTVRPLGFHYLHPYGTVPADSIICNGATYSRALYKDFFDYITTQGWVKTEAEWQKIAKRDNGFCPFYSEGDGSTTFRTPKFAPYQQITIASGNVGKYHDPGLPNIKGSLNPIGQEEDSALPTGAFSKASGRCMTGSSFFAGKGVYEFDASRYNSIFGNSNTVQPESHEWVVCVVAYGIATNVGSVDIQNVMSAVNAVQASVTEVEGKISSKLEDSSTVHIIETWKSTDGNSRYHKWSDGWLEQGGRLKLEVWTGGRDPNRTFSLPTAFSNATYTTVVTGEGGYGWADLKVVSQTTSSITVTGSGASTDDHVSYVHFYCSGY